MGPQLVLKGKYTGTTRSTFFPALLVQSFTVSTAWDSEIESLTSLTPSLIELDRRKNAAQTPSDCGVGPEKELFPSL